MSVVSEDFNVSLSLLIFFHDLQQFTIERRIVLGQAWLDCLAIISNLYCMFEDFCISEKF